MPMAEKGALEGVAVKVGVGVLVKAGDAVTDGVGAPAPPVTRQRRSTERVRTLDILELAGTGAGWDVSLDG